MATTFTPTLNLEKPEVAGDLDVWGNKSNANWDKVDAAAKALGDRITLVATTPHTHTTAEVVGLDAALAGKAPLVHTHAIADVTGLQASLDSKAPSTHTHAASSISGLGTGAMLNVGTGPGNVVALDAGSKLPPVDGSQLTGVAGFTLLGSLATTSSNSHSISSVDLTPYKFLWVIFNAVDPAGGATAKVLRVGTFTVVTTASAKSNLVTIELSSGLAFAEAGGAGASGITNASTSVSVTTDGIFKAGRVTIYGLR